MGAMVYSWRQRKRKKTRSFFLSLSAFLLMSFQILDPTGPLSRHPCMVLAPVRQWAPFLPCPSNPGGDSSFQLLLTCSLLCFSISRQIFHHPFNQLSILNPICLKDAEDCSPGSILTDTILSYKL